MQVGTFPGYLARVGPLGTLEFTPAVRGLLRAHLQRFEPGTPVEVRVTRWRLRRSSRAERFYRGFVVPPIAARCGYDPREMHHLLALKFLRIADDPITGSPRHADTDSLEAGPFTAYVEACIGFATDLGVTIPAAPGQRAPA